MMCTWNCFMISVKGQRQAPHPFLRERPVRTPPVAITTDCERITGCSCTKTMTQNTCPYITNLSIYNICRRSISVYVFTTITKGLLCFFWYHLGSPFQVLNFAHGCTNLGQEPIGELDLSGWMVVEQPDCSTNVSFCFLLMPAIRSVEV